MLILIDNYDSFTFNLYQYLGELGERIQVYRNDQISIDDITSLNPEAIILSPGPGRPENAGICVEIIQTFYNRIPILGICLGHQAIGYTFGGNVKQAKKIMHGKTSLISHNEENLFSGIPNPFEVMRYHSLVVESSRLPDHLKSMAFATDDQEIMALKHETYPVYGVQFHPESVGTIHGKQLLANFLNLIREGSTNEGLFGKIV
ncbi:MULTISPECIES: aminodeoxychorismate/anthranilate synthase component II [unclassified Bacillus (in: firmicutes)]|uniref:anthranilate synthase component II n=1 Tax=unclassified Bacillus (in: firmicutes) TaxID=185979 RepID=UPI0008E89AD5|nr:MULTISPECIES: aminodeoxychorismate/anthranilate synthase component II [unclassified Bacillus (in: firmicutes)]SFA91642.1 anthranilate synthase component 2 [Bacillus sp. UNCCL13]SFQ85621.1 anthranilate synthase component 2 [Bacillus sp. cl95]